MKKHNKMLLAVVAAIAIAVPTMSVTASATAATKKVITCSTKAPKSTDKVLAKAQAELLKAATPSTKWTGPTTGPKAQKKGGTVVVIPSVATNEGDSTVFKGFTAAATALGWTVKTIDGGGTASNNQAAFEQALALKPIGILVSSMDPAAMAPEFAKAKAAGIPVVSNHTGWYAGPSASSPDLFTNITSDPATIARVAADCALVASNGKAFVSISSCGNELSICVTKEDSIAKTIKSAKGSKVLVTHYYPFEDHPLREGGFAAADYQKYGKKLNFRLSVNDGYADASIPNLKALGVTRFGPPLFIAAGDGSVAAFKRIRAGQFQIATVAEPLLEHGWQMADELNRALAGAKPSGYVTYPHITTIENVNLEGGRNNTYDPANGYAAAYKKIWGVK
jgi:ribose transport system substrate-binding protein